MIMTSSANKLNFRLTATEKILLHLLRYSKLRKDMNVPIAITQKGIAEAVQIRWNHVPRAMKKLINQGFVEEERAHIDSKVRRQKAYYLSDDGINFTKGLENRISRQEIRLKKQNGEIEVLKLSELNNSLKTSLTVLEIVLSIGQEQVVDAEKLLAIQRGKHLKKPSRHMELFVSGVMHKPETFIGREKEIETLRKWMESERYGTIVIWGSLGIGKTALIANFLDEYKYSRNIFWYELPSDNELGSILVSLSKFFSKLGRKNLLSYLEKAKEIDLSSVLGFIEEDLKKSDTLFIFDGYFSAKEDVVDFFRGFVNVIAGIQNVKLIFSARDDMPFYCRLYDKRDIQVKRIAEMKLKGLSLRESKDILGNPDIDQASMRTIHQMTRGHPLTLELVKAGNEEGLRKLRGFRKQEASLLMFLKSRKK